jgi:hypothetical protein
VTIEWEYKEAPVAGVLSLSGHLGSQAIDRFAGAIGWAFAHGTGPIIVDLTGLQSWSASDREAVLGAAARLAEHDRGLELVGWPGDRIVLVPIPEGLKIRHHPDLQAALSACASVGSLKPGQP